MLNFAYFIFLIIRNFLCPKFLQYYILVLLFWSQYHWIWQAFALSCSVPLIDPNIHEKSVIKVQNNLLGMKCYWVCWTAYTISQISRHQKPRLSVCYCVMYSESVSTLLNRLNAMVHQSMHYAMMLLSWCEIAALYLTLLS